MAGLTLWTSSAGISAVLVVWALSGYYIALMWRFMGLGIWREVDEMALYKIHAVEGNYTEPDSNVVLTEILWAYKELLVSSYAEERSALATRCDVVAWN